MFTSSPFSFHVPYKHTAFLPLFSCLSSTRSRRVLSESSGGATRPSASRFTTADCWSSFDHSTRQLPAIAWATGSSFQRRRCEPPSAQRALSLSLPSTGEESKARLAGPASPARAYRLTVREVFIRGASCNRNRRAAGRDELAFSAKLPAHELCVSDSKQAMSNTMRMARPASKRHSKGRNAHHCSRTAEGKRRGRCRSLAHAGACEHEHKSPAASQGASAPEPTRTRPFLHPITVRVGSGCRWRCLINDKQQLQSFKMVPNQKL
jgi:hypothetical protein